MTWKQVDRRNVIVKLEGGETKNGEGRTVYLDEELKALFEEQYQAVLKRGKIILYVFLNKDGTDKIKDFRSPWNNACRKTGLGYRYKASRKYVEKWKNELPAGPILHGLRRTAIRNMIRFGTPERVAMMISGRKTGHNTEFGHKERRCRKWLTP